MIDNIYHRKNFSSAKLKTIFDYTFSYYICSRSLWYMDIVKNGFNTVKH
jgi:hypothetical protein